jgi:hypothetical protein
MESPRSALVEQVIGVLNTHDPMAFEPGGDGAPWDEYELEARDLAELLHSTGTVTGAQVDAVWVKWFSQPIGNAEAIATDIRALRP